MTALLIALIATLAVLLPAAAVAGWWAGARHADAESRTALRLMAGQLDPATDHHVTDEIVRLARQAVRGGAR